jgi:peroxiredoxin
MANFFDVDWSKLPVPVDDGAAAHLQGTRLSTVPLAATDGRAVDLSAEEGLVVVFIYPMTGRPGVPLPAGWDEIPGARGCTPQSCAFRDHATELRELGVTSIFGLSSQDTAYQAEAVTRLHLPFAILSDARFALTDALRLPCFDVAGTRLLKRLTMVLFTGRVEKVFYPVFPPDRSAGDVVAWLRTAKRQAAVESTKLTPRASAEGEPTSQSTVDVRWDALDKRAIELVSRVREASAALPALPPSEDFLCWDVSHTYGELLPDATAAALRRALSLLPPGGGFTFLDLGSGEGVPVVLASALFPEFRRVCGVELLPRLHTVAERHVAQLTAAAAARVTLRCGDMMEGLEGDLANADVVFFLGTCFGEDVLGPLWRACEQALRRGAVLICASHEAPAALFELCATEAAPASWGGMATLRFYKRAGLF